MMIVGGIESDTRTRPSLTMMRRLRVLWWKLRRAFELPPPPPRPRLTVKQGGLSHDIPDIGELVLQFPMSGKREALMAKAAELGEAFVDIDRIAIGKDALAQIPREVAIRRHLMPLKLQGDTLYVAISLPIDLAAIDEASMASNKRIIPVLALEEAIAGALTRYYHEPNSQPPAPNS